GQRVKKILYPEQCANLLEGDTIVELDGRNVRAIPHTQLVDMLRECPVKSILPGGLAAEDGVLQPGDVLVRVNGELLLGASQSDACRIFVNIPVGDPVAIQVCRGYPLLLDPSNRVR
ncbi:unnamed protein product, partial [Haemonchus placei]|uniref:PDZ domain-containing protein n=1 Tax=Haemonchus placei TaxID=6290 RepID=A0A0N4VYP9_HAEPC